MLIIGLVALILGGVGVTGFAFTRTGFRDEGLLVRVGGSEASEGFRDSPVCNKCNKPRRSCKHRNNKSGSRFGTSNSSSSQYNTGQGMGNQGSSNILNTMDMSSYMLKTECPPVPDLSKYVLKASIPKPQPVIIDNSKCKGDAGECPPCPRPRCPVVKCPPPTKCPTPAPCPRPLCPPTVVKCKSEETTQPTVRPFLAPLNMSGFGLA